MDIAKMVREGYIEFGGCMIEDVAFLGLGHMGTPMAFNLLRSGARLYVYNRTKEKAEPLVNEGAKLLTNPDQTFEKTPLAFSMLSDDQALIKLSEEMLKNGKPNCIHVSMSTVSPETSRMLAKKHAEKGVKFIAAPVFGRPDLAKTGKLWICFAGDRQVKSLVEPLLLHMGQKIYDFGEDPGNANVIKLTGNFLILSIAEMLAEAYAAAEQNGIDVKNMHNFFTDTLFPSPVIKLYGMLIANRAFSPAGLKMTLGLKDITLFSETTQELKLAYRDILKKKLEEGIANGLGDLDWSAIALSSFDQLEKAKK